MTLQRLVFLAAIAVPVSMLHILFFFGFEATTTDEQLWHQGIIAAHFTQAVLFSLIGLAARRYQSQPHLWQANATFWSALLLVIISGASITILDQLVTTAVTPFLVACTIAGVIFLLSPRQALSVYSGAFALFFLGLELTQSDPAILLSNRVNGLTATGIAAGLSLMLWHHTVTRKDQEQKIAEQQQALQASNQMLEELASRDDLTGLLNRRLFDLMVQQELAALARDNKTSALLMLDIDHFKSINDSYGHLCGDQILRELSALLQQMLRASDLCGRWGGEEFVILLRDTQANKVPSIAENIRQSIEDRIFVLDGRSHRITVSIGCTLLDPNDPEPMLSAYQHADLALYQAKSQGRNRVVMRKTT
ncbi:hypothetical protein PS2015_358 [Pseudohongiella spirulinae]|uniref:diguanylate cyclase n=2 Tax=Pseudohongiella spirulinae TaxID=1249552 RepID=A0A0S2K9V7_9GAMM|nr:hypothetical protein PS2015_358 [Pseudohongiella spirulinae]